MTGGGFVYDAAVLDALNDAIDFGSGGFKVMLVTSAYVPDPTHMKLNDIAADAIAAGGMDIPVALVAKAPARADVQFDATTWPPATIAARGAIVYRERGGDPASDDLFAFIDFGTVVRCTGGAFTLGGATFSLQPRFYDRARVLVASAGTDDIELGGPAPGFSTLAYAGFETGDRPTYGVSGAAGIEIGSGTYRNDAGRESISCQTVFYSSTGAPIAFSAGDKVYVDMPIGGDKVYVALGAKPASLADFLAMIEEDRDPLEEILDLLEA